MKFLVDESVEYRLVLHLRSLSYDTYSVAEQSPSLDDKSILEFAYSHGRILITNDKDFGELIYRLKLPHRGVIFFRLKNEDSRSKIKTLELLLNNYKDKLKDRFVVVTETKVRFRK